MLGLWMHCGKSLLESEENLLETEKGGSLLYNGIKAGYITWNCIENGEHA